MSETIIGIDLGTTTTEAAIFRDDKSEMILNFDGNVVTPSAVGLDESGNFIVGEKARTQFIFMPEKTAIEMKRKIGTGEKIRLGKESFSAKELSSILLSYVKRYASQYLGEDVTRAVISVPAYFDDLQRQEVVEAGKKAGFVVERIINEPTAAALSYGISHLEEESYILVYDLGGGTFDVTLLEMFDGVLEVKASSGDNKLGGKDFDEKLIEWLKSRFEDQYGVKLSGNIHAMARLKEQAEKCKIALSSQEEVTVQIPMLAEKKHVPLALEETITRAQFEELIGELVKKTHDPINVVLADSGVSREELAMILLVGGSTRVPLIARDLEEFLGKEPVTEVNPDYCVAEGAAVCGAMIAGILDESKGLVMTDVNPYTLGIRTVDWLRDDIMSVIIPRNVTIPVTKHDVFSTQYPGQTKAEIEVYQGESGSVWKNHFLGKFTLDGIPFSDEREELDVAFSYNMNGMLQVEATIVKTGKKANLSIDLMENEKEEKIDVSGWKGSSCASAYRSVIRRAEKYLQKYTPQDSEDKSRLEELGEQLYQLKKAILEENEDKADALADKVEDMLEN